MKLVDIFTDGACSGNPGPGGYGAILKFNGTVKEISGGEEQTTNNRMELMAVIKSLELLKEKCIVNLHSDSKYIIDAIQKGWVYKWKENNWIKSDKKRALNVDLWEDLLVQLNRHNVNLIWVKGHAGHIENERCDQLAVLESKKFIK